MSDLEGIFFGALCGLITGVIVTMHFMPVTFYKGKVEAIVCDENNNCKTFYVKEVKQRKGK